MDGPSYGEKIVLVIVMTLLIATPTVTFLWVNFLKTRFADLRRRKRGRTKREEWLEALARSAPDWEQEIGKFAAKTIQAAVKADFQAARLLFRSSEHRFLERQCARIREVFPTLIDSQRLRIRLIDCERGDDGTIQMLTTEITTAATKNQFENGWRKGLVWTFRSQEVQSGVREEQGINGAWALQRLNECYLSRALP